MKHPKLIKGLFLTLTCLLMPTFVLYAVDPWRVAAYYDDLNAVWLTLQADATREYGSMPGEYQFSNWQATILANQSRLIPDTPPQAHCTIALLGDSVTYGFGVNDSDTWANQVALKFPRVQFLNTGVIGYNIAQVAVTRQATPANGYLYLLINNDADKTVHWQRGEITRQTPFTLVLDYLYIYETRLRNGSTGAVTDYGMFDNTLAQFKTLPNVAVVGFDNDPLAHHAGVALIPAWTHAISYTDGHPNRAGHIQIANALTPYLNQLIEQVCRV